MDKFTTQKINIKVRELTAVMIQMDLPDIDRTFHPLELTKEGDQVNMYMNVRSQIFIICR